MIGKINRAIRRAKAALKRAEHKMAVEGDDRSMAMYESKYGHKHSAASMDAEIRTIQRLVKEFEDRYGDAVKMLAIDRDGRLFVTCAADSDRFEPQAMPNGLSEEIDD